MTTRAVLVVIVLVAIGCALLFVRAAGHEPSPYSPVPQAAFTPILPQASLLPVYPAPLAWSPPVLPITFPGPTDQPKPKPRPKPAPPVPKPNLIGSIRGTSTWYCLPSWPSKCMKVHPNPRGMFAAAGPALRWALGSHWRNHLVKVTNLANGRAVWVRLADWCLCTGKAKPIIDLYSGPFAMLSGRSFSSPGGGLEVKISW